MKRFTIAVTLAVVVFVTNLDAQRRTPIRNLLFGNRSVARTTANVGWSYNSLKRHLEGPPHYLNVNGWTYNQMLAEHNRDHARIDSGTKWQTSVWSPTTVSYVSAPVQTTSRTRTVQRNWPAANVQRTRTVQRVCANGVCSNAQVVFDPVTTWYETAPVVEYSPVVVSTPRPKVVRNNQEIDSHAIHLAAAPIQETFGARGRSEFIRKILKELPEVRRTDPNVSFRDAINLRAACLLTPGFVELSYERAVDQLQLEVEPGDENVPTDNGGKVIEAGINWEGLTAFVQVLIPLLIKLLQEI